MGLNSFSSIVAPLFSKLLGGAGAAQQPSTTERQVEATTPLGQVNAAVREKSQQELQQLSAPEQIATAPSAAAIMPEVLLGNQAEPLKAINQGEIKPAIKLEFSEEALKSLKPMLSAFKDLVKSLLPELNLKELAATARPVFQALFPQVSPELQSIIRTAVLRGLSQAGSNPANAPTPIANPA